MTEECQLSVLPDFALFWFFGSVLPFLFDKKPDETFQANFIPANCYGDSIGPERVRVIDTPEEALFWRLKIIEDAKNHLRLSTYDLRSDTSGQKVMAALYDAAERDVTVDILVDSMCGVARLKYKPHFKALRAHPNVTVKFYNPLHPLKPKSAMIRLHDKYIIGDDTAYLLGGRNINDLFLDPESETCNFDRDLFVVTDESDIETSTAYLTHYFDTIWTLDTNRALRRPHGTSKIADAEAELKALKAEVIEAYPKLMEDMDLRSLTLPTRQVTILHNPIEVRHKEPNLWFAMTQLMADGEEAVLQTPYVIMSRSMTDDLKKMVASGTRVDVVTNSPATNANYWGAADYLNQKSRILRTGVTLYETAMPVSNHAKTLLIDDRMSLVGSFNCDMRSAYLNTEVMVTVDSPELNGELTASIESQKAQSLKREKDKTPVPGDQYVKPLRTPAQWLLQQILRVVILPIRHLL